MAKIKKVNNLKRNELVQRNGKKSIIMDIEMENQSSFPSIVSSRRRSYN
jgi:hypothetical protein